MAAPSEVKGKSVGEIITGWNAELERQTRAFGAHARALAEWDRTIWRNRRALAALEGDVERSAAAAAALERQLAALEVHQANVAESLSGMERAAEALAREGLPAAGAARERDALFAQAEDVAARLAEIGVGLRDTVAAVNAAPPPDAAVDPLAAAVAVLNNQLSTLVYLDQAAAQLAQRVGELQG